MRDAGGLPATLDLSGFSWHVRIKADPQVMRLDAGPVNGAAASYELHVTVRPPPAGMGDLHRIAAGLGCTCLDIELAHGLVPRQPMFTRHVVGDWPAARAGAAALVRALRAAGLAVRRVKIEAELWNPGVPATAAEALAHPGRYFEHHVKVRCARAGDLDRLARAVEPLGGHLSRTLHSAGPEGEERFVTQRCPGCGRAQAQARLQDLVQLLSREAVVIVKTISEYVMHDSRSGLDAGWSDADEAEGGD